MRHRSHIAFILVAAALFAAPQVSHDLSTLKGAVAARIRGEILQAFLGLHAGESAPAAEAEATAPRAYAALASCDARKAEGQEGKGAPAKSAERAARRTASNAQANTDAQANARTQLAMLGDPSDKANAGLPPAALAAELASLPREMFAERRLAMLTAPGNGVEPPPQPAPRDARDAQSKAASSASRERSAETERRALYIQARFEQSADGAQWVRRIAEESARAVEQNSKVRARVLKVRRPFRACGGGDNAAPCAPVPVAAAAPTAPNLDVLVSLGE